MAWVGRQFKDHQAPSSLPQAGVPTSISHTRPVLGILSLAATATTETLHLLLFSFMLLWVEFSALYIWIPLPVYFSLLSWISFLLATSAICWLLTCANVIVLFYLGMLCFLCVFSYHLINVKQSNTFPFFQLPHMDSSAHLIVARLSADSDDCLLNLIKHKKLSVSKCICSLLQSFVLAVRCKFKHKY